MSLSEWADRFRVLSRESSPEPGQWVTDRAPYQRGIMDACTDPRYERVVFMKSAQVGATEIVNNMVGYYIDQDPSPILVVQPTVDPMAKAWSKDRLAPMLRDTPCLQDKVSDPRSRDSGNTILHKEFPGGHLTCVGANSPSGLASRPIRVLLLDEVDRYEVSAGSEGDPVTLATARTKNFWNRRIFMGSTPHIKGASRIEAAFEESDQRHYHVPCPHCGYRQRLRWAGLKWEHRDPSTAMYLCGNVTEDGELTAGCGKLIDEIEKPGMLAKGEWVITNPERSVPGFHINALYSPWTTWPELVREWLDAQGNFERLKTFVNLQLGETWEEQAERPDEESLRARVEDYGADVPVGVGVITAGVDVQNDRLELLLIGWGVGFETWRLGHWRIYGDPVHEAVWQRLEVLLTRPYQHEGGAVMRLSACGIDSGGHHTDAVYKYVRPREKRGIYALKGQSQRGKPIVGRPGKRNQAGVRVFPVGTDTAKDVLFARIRVRHPGPGYMHFPPPTESGGDDEYFAQFAAEKAVTKFVKGVPTRMYVQTRQRNEAIDLEVYAMAALHILGAAVLEHMDEWVERVKAEGQNRKTVRAPRRRVRSAGVV